MGFLKRGQSCGRLFKVKLPQSFDIRLRQAQFFRQIFLDAAIFLVDHLKELNQM
mgnify:CR=1 FL=1